MKRLLLVVVTTMALMSCGSDSNPQDWHRQYRQDCINAGGQVKEDYNGYYDGCIYPQPVLPEVK